MHRLLAACLFLAVYGNVHGQGFPVGKVKPLLSLVKENRQDTPTLYAMAQLADYEISKPGENKPDLDSAEAWLRQARELNARLGSKTGEGFIELEEGLLTKERGRHLAAIDDFKKTIRVLQGLPDSFLLGRAYLCLSQVYGYTTDSEVLIRVPLVENAITCFNAAHAYFHMGFCQENLTDLYQLMGRYDDAIAMGLKGVATYESIHYPNLAGPYMQIGQAYLLKKNYELAITWLQKAERNADGVHNRSMQRCQLDYILATTYAWIRELDRSERYLWSALKIAGEHQDSTQMYVVATSQAHVLVDLGKSGEAVHFLDSLQSLYRMPHDPDIEYRVLLSYVQGYTQLGNREKATEYFQRLLPYLNKFTVGVHSMYVYNTAVRYYIFMKQYAEARQLFPKLIASAKATDRFVSSGTAYLTAFELDTIQHYYDRAVADMLTYKTIQDSLYNENRARDIQELQISYETAEKEKDIAFLQTAGELQRRALAQSNQTRNLSAMGAVLLLLLLGIGFSRYRLKQHKNRELEVKQKEISAKNVQLGKLLQENEWLLREVHHRVKNNLQVVMSLLNSQSAYLQDEKALNAVLESQHRVQAMSLIHQKLYKSSDVSSIYMPEYVNDLVDYLKDSFNGGSKVRFELQIAAINLDVVQAVPVGLILNEVITNAFKHAFPHGAGDMILIRLLTTRDGETTLVIADNGRGFPVDLDAIVNNSFGRLLIHGLVEDLDGSMTVDRSDGTGYCIHFQQTVPGEKNRVAAEAMVGGE
jgi:two-component system, sensor histidine kinase PdtaS